jgi:hypothetical protein
MNGLVARVVTKLRKGCHTRWGVPAMEAEDW